MDNITSINMEETMKAIEFCVQKKQHINIPLLMWGNHGIGKTALVNQVGAKLNYEVVHLNLASISVEDLLGQIDGKGGYYKPTFINDKKKTIYFLDELNRAPKYMIQSVFTLINEGRIHNYRLNKDDYVMGACNPTDSYEVTAFEDPAFLSRFCHLKVVPDKKEFLNYLGSKKLKNTVIQEALGKSMNLYKQDSFDIGFNVSPDNRNLEKIAYVFEHCKDVDTVGKNIIEGLVGFDSMSIIMEVYTASKKNNIDVKTLLNYKSSKDFPFKDNHLDVLNNVSAKIIEYLRNDNNISEVEHKGLVNYFNFIPKDLQAVFMKQIVDVYTKFVDAMDFDTIKKVTNHKV